MGYYGVINGLIDGIVNYTVYTIIILDFCWDCKTYYHWDYHAYYYHYSGINT